MATHSLNQDIQMEEAMDCDTIREDRAVSPGGRVALLAVQVVALPFLLVAIALWGSLMAIMVLAHGIAVVINALVGSLQDARIRHVPGASSGLIPSEMERSNARVVSQVGRRLTHANTSKDLHTR